MEIKKNTRTKYILMGLIALLVLIIAAVAFVLVNGKMKETNYQAATKEAEKYLAENNYEQAIIEYQNAISINPDKEEPYLALSDIYMEQENISRAKSILRTGYERTGSSRIRSRLNGLENQELTGKGEKETEEIDLATASKNIAWDTSFVQKIVSYTFNDYKSEFGRVTSAETDDDGYLEIRHEKLNATCYYRNTADNKDIVDSSKKQPYGTGMPEKITLDSLGILFRNFDGGASLQRMQMLFGETVKPKTQEGSIYIESKEEDIIAKIGTDSKGNIVASSTWNELLLPMANKKSESADVLEGVVVDAVSGTGVTNAELTFKPRNSSHQTVTEKTDSKGVFRVQLEADTYSITIKASGYIPEEFSFTVKEGRSYSGEQFVISPELSGEARIVLEWGAEPEDLDSHLIGTTDGGSNIHVYYGDETASSGGAKVAELDLDDLDGYGPETTTIYDLNGVYFFSVVDFRGTGTMAANGATVKIYLPGQSPVTVELNTGSGVGNIWEVCKIDHGNLEIINDAGSLGDYGALENY